MTRKLTIQYQRVNSDTYSYHTENKVVMIGRGDESLIDLNLPGDKKVSRMHARLYFDNNGWWLRDLGSKHGTYHNAKLITGNVSLKSGDVIAVGETILQVIIPRAVVQEDAGIPIDLAYVVDETLNDGHLSEHERLELLYHLTNVADDSLASILDNIVAIIHRRYPSASQVGLASYQDGQVMPLAFTPGAQAHYSVDLAKQVVHKREATIWRVPDKASPGEIRESLKGVYSAMYVPIIRNQLARGVLYVHSSTEDFNYQIEQLQLLNGISQVVSEVLAGKAGETDGRIPDVFVSYAHEDRDFVLTLVNDLRKRSINVWCDDRLQPGDLWEDSIMNAIAMAGSFVLVVSEACVQSKFISREIDQALSHNKVIFPLIYQEPVSKIREEIERYQYIRPGGDYSSLLDEISYAIYSQFERSMDDNGS